VPHFDPFWSSNTDFINLQARIEAEEKAAKKAEEKAAKEDAKNSKKDSKLSKSKTSSSKSKDKEVCNRESSVVLFECLASR